MLIFKQFEFLSICTKNDDLFFSFFFKDLKKKNFSSRNLMNAAQNSYSNIYSRRILLCSNSYHIQIQFQYFVAFDLSSISLQSYSNSFFVCNHIFIWILFRFCLRYMFNPFVFAGSRPDESKSRAPQAKKKSNQHNFVGSMSRRREKQWARRKNWVTEEQKKKTPKRETVRPKRKLSDRRTKT